MTAWCPTHSARKDKARAPEDRGEEGGGEEKKRKERKDLLTFFFLSLG